MDLEEGVAGGLRRSPLLSMQPPKVVGETLSPYPKVRESCEKPDNSITEHDESGMKMIDHEAIDIRATVNLDLADKAREVLVVVPMAVVEEAESEGGFATIYLFNINDREMSMY